MSSVAWEGRVGAALFLSSFVVAVGRNKRIGAGDGSGRLDERRQYQGAAVRARGAIAQ